MSRTLFIGDVHDYLETHEFWQVRANRVYKEPEHWKIKKDI